MKFIPRLTAPSGNNKYYIKTTYGGYNRDILIDKVTGSVLPDCTGYSWGRFLEIAGITDCKLSTGNAEDWWGYNDGYPRGQEVKLGATICWRKGKVGVGSDGYGHVGTVEAIEGDFVTVSMSAYKGKRWYTRRYKKGSYDYNGYVFQGFIYNPYIDDDPSPKKDIDTIAREIIQGKWGNGQERWDNLTKAGYTEEEQRQIQNRVNEILQEQKTFKVGDSVKIIAAGNSQSNGKGKVAGGIGWIRTIKRIYKDRAYPYQVGDNSGTTGFYKGNALKKA